MDAALLVVVSAAVLYALWMLLDFVFQMIENYHAAQANSRTNGGKLSGRRDA